MIERQEIGGPLSADELEVEIAAPGAFERGVSEGASVIPMDDGGAEVEFGPGGTSAADYDPEGNIAEQMDDRELTALGNDILGFKDEFKESRKDWENAYAKGLKMLGFKFEDSRPDAPFEGASAVHHPLLAEAATQFQSHAYKELFPSAGPVRTAIHGEKTPERVSRASRLKTYLNYHLTTTMVNFEEDFDSMLWYLPLAGSTFKKTYYDHDAGHEQSVFVPAERIFVPYGTGHLTECPVIIELIDMSLDELTRHQTSGFYSDIDVHSSLMDTADSIRVVQDEIAGESLPTGESDFTVQILEAHIGLTLEGFDQEDEAKTPYIVTVLADTGEVLSVRESRDPKRSNRKREYYTHYKFMQGFGFYGNSLIHMIGGLNKAATGALRALLDAGAFSNLPAGFKARGLRIENDGEPFKPGHFQDVDVAGGTIRDAVIPLPFKGPDQTLFALLGFLVSAGQRFASTTDLQVGEGNQNAPVGTTIALLEGGQRVLTAVHKRVHRAQKRELELITGHIMENPRAYPSFISSDDGELGPADDLRDDVGILPVTDPEFFSQAQRIARAQTQLELAKSAPDIHNLPEAFRMMHEAIGSTDIDRLMITDSTDHGEPVPKDPAMEHIDALEGVPLTAFEGQMHDAHILGHMLQGVSQITQSNPKAMVELHKHILEHIRLKAKEQVKAQLEEAQLSEEEMMDPEIAVAFDGMLAQAIAAGMQEAKELSMQVSGGGQPPPDPLLELKGQELADRKAANEAQLQIDAGKLELDREKAAQKAREFQLRFNQTNQINQDRLDNRLDAIRLQKRVNPNPGQ